MKRTRVSIALALTLIGIGVWFLAVELNPQLKAFAYGASTWPLPIVGVGAFLALVGLLTWTPGFMIPACIVAGVGGLLYWQNFTGDWKSWSYAWAFIPGFVGIGILLTGLLSRTRGAIVGGFWVIFNSLVMLAVFGAVFGGKTLVTRYWPVLLITFGLVLLAQGTLRRK